MLAEFQLGPISIENPNILVSQILGFILFALFVWFLPKTIPLGVPFLKDATSERSARIGENLALVETAVSDTQRIHDDYAARLRSVEAEANQRIEAAVREAEIARGDIIADAQTAAEQLRRRAEEEIARESVRQRILLRRQIVQITLDAAEQSVRAMNSDKTQRNLIQDFIARAANGAPAAGSASAFAAPAPTFAASAAPVFETPNPIFETPARIYENPATLDRTEGS